MLGDSANNEGPQRRVMYCIGNITYFKCRVLFPRPETLKPGIPDCGGTERMGCHGTHPVRFGPDTRSYSDLLIQGCLRAYILGTAPTQ